MPLVMQAWNTYRNRALAVWLQNNGIEVIPNVHFGDERGPRKACFTGKRRNRPKSDAGLFKSPAN